MNVRTLALFSVLGSAFVCAPAALAAPAPQCTYATVTPNATRVPANFPGFAYNATGATASDIHLRDLTAQTTDLAVDFAPQAANLVKVTPSAALVVGHRYELDYDQLCSAAPYLSPGTVTFQVTDAVPLPTRFGDIIGKPSATKEGEQEVAVNVTVGVDAATVPWIRAMEFSLEMDGQPLTTGGTVALADDHVDLVAYTFCENATTHKFVAKAKLPFSTTVQTSEVSLDVPCSGTPATNVGGDNVGTTNGGKSSNGGGCSVGRGTGASSGLALAGLLGLVWTLRNRRQRRKG